MKKFASIALSVLLVASLTLGGALTAISFQKEADSIQIVVRPMDVLPIAIAQD